jgi:hypothetical protein
VEIRCTLFVCVIRALRNEVAQFPMESRHVSTLSGGSSAKISITVGLGLITHVILTKNIELLYMVIVLCFACFCWRKMTE